MFGVGSLLGNIPGQPNPYIAKESLGYTIVIEEGSAYADVADMPAAALKIADWGNGLFQQGEGGDPLPDGSLTMWDKTSYDTRTEEVHILDKPLIWSSGATLAATITIMPNAGGGFHITLIVPPGGSITINVQGKEIRAKYMDQ